MKKVLIIAAIVLALLGTVVAVLMGRWLRMDDAAAERFTAELEGYRQAGGLSGADEIRVGPIAAELDAYPLYEKAFHFIRTAEKRSAPAADFTPLSDDPELEEFGDRGAEPMDEEALRRLDGFLARHAGAVQALRAAASRPACRYPTRYSESWSAELPHIRDLIAGARLLSLQAERSARQGRLEEAYATMDAIFAAGMSVVDEPLVVSQLVRLVVLSIGLERVESVLSRGAPSAADVAAWRGRLDVGRMNSGLAAGHAGDFACVVGSMRSFLAGRGSGTDLEQGTSSFKLRIARPRLREACARNLARLAACLEALNAPFATRDAVLAAESPRIAAETLGFGIFLGDLTKPGRHQAALEIRLHLAFRAIEIRRGMTSTPAPETAEAGKDPIFGASLVYRRTATGFVLEPGPELAALTAFWNLDPPLRWELAAPPQ